MISLCHVLCKLMLKFINFEVVYQVTLLVFVIMIASAVIIWIGMGQNPIDSALVARV